MKVNNPIMKLRSIGKFFGILFFTTFLTLLIFSYTFSKFTSFENLNGIVPVIVKNVFAQSMGNLTEDEINLMISSYCQFEKEFTIPQIDNILTENISINCDELNTENPIETLTEKLFKTVYYQNHSCELVNCLTSGNFIALISNKTHQFLVKLENTLLFLTLLSGGLMLLFIESWPGRLKTLGTILISNGIPLFLLVRFQQHLINWVVNKFGYQNVVELIIESLFAPFDYLYKILLLLGAVLLGIGFIISFYYKPIKKDKRKVKRKKK